MSKISQQAKFKLMSGQDVANAGQTDGQTFSRQNHPTVLVNAYSYCSYQTYHFKYIHNIHVDGFEIREINILKGWQNYINLKLLLNGKL